MGSAIKGGVVDGVSAVVGGTKFMAEDMLGYLVDEPLVACSKTTAHSMGKVYIPSIETLCTSDCTKQVLLTCQAASANQASPEQEQSPSFAYGPATSPYVYTPADDTYGPAMSPY